MKRSITILLIYGTFFFSAIPLYAQSPCAELPLPQEQVRIHLDRNVCLAGETIWFKAWCFLDGQLAEEMSKVLYVEIFDESQKVIVQEKYLLTDHKAAGSIRIPEDVPSKYYFLKAYTRYMRNFSSSSFHYQQLTIVNPLIEGGSIPTKVARLDKTPVNSSIPPAFNPSAGELLKIELNKEKYLPREAIHFHLESLKPLSAELSATVRWQGLGNQPAPQVMLHNKWLMASCEEDPFCRSFYPTENPSDDSSILQGQEKALLQGGDDLEWLPETRGLTISGLVQNEKKENRAGALTMVSVLQKTPLLYMGTTDEQGVFTICLQHLQDQKDLFVGTPEEKNTVLIRNDFDSNPPEVTTVPLQFDSTFHRLLSSLNLHQQLDRTYPKNKTQAVFQSKPLAIASTNLLTPDKRIVLGDFIKIPTMSEVYEELIPGVRIQKKEGKENLSVFNVEQQKWEDSPLILLDNVPIFDISELLKIDPAKVEAIETYHSAYILGDYTIGAIISIITKTNNFASYKWGEQTAFTTFKAFAVPQVFEQVVHLKKSHFPDFRPVLYWQPSIPLKQEKISETLSIFAPDRPGVYEVLVQGFTNLGEPCMGYITFEVVQNK